MEQLNRNIIGSPDGPSQLVVHDIAIDLAASLRTSAEKDVIGGTSSLESGKLHVSKKGRCLRFLFPLNDRSLEDCSSPPVAQRVLDEGLTAN